MSSIFQKGRNIVLGDIHTLLNVVQDWNSVGSLEQHERDVQVARDSIDNQVALQSSKAEGSLPDEIATLQAQISEIDGNITSLVQASRKAEKESNLTLKATKEKQATTLQIDLDSKTAQIKSKQMQLANAQALATKYSDAVLSLDTRLAEIRARLVVLRELEQQTAETVKQNKLLSGVSLGDMPGTDNIEQRLRDKAVVAQHELDRNLGRLAGDSSGGGSVAQATASAKIEQRKQAIAAAQVQATTSSDGK